MLIIKQVVPRLISIFTTHADLHANQYSSVPCVRANRDDADGREWVPLQREDPW